MSDIKLNVLLINFIQLCTTPVACIIQNKGRNIFIDVFYHLSLIYKNGRVRIRSKVHTYIPLHTISFKPNISPYLNMLNL